MQLWSHRITFVGVSTLLTLLSTTWALNLQGFNGNELNPFEDTVLPPDRMEQASPIVQGACYSPFHNAQYPLNGGSAAGLDSAMDTDFSIMKNYVSVVRTYYSSYYGYSVAPYAAKYGISLYLGVYMTDESWYEDQVNAAIAAVKNYPNTIKAILVGNENIAPAGPYSPAEVLRRISALRARILSETGRSVNIGTVQRHNEWMDTSIRDGMLALAASSEIIGVNIYPFFDASYSASNPLAMLNGAWNSMLTVYPFDKVRLTEIGFPTAGAPPPFAPNNVPSVANSIAFYKAFLNWSPTSGGQEVFWFMFFDRRPDDNTMGLDLERFFGFFTYARAKKVAGFPNLVTTTSAPASTTAPAPVPTTTTMTPASTPKACRVRKVFSG